MSQRKEFRLTKVQAEAAANSYDEITIALLMIGMPYEDLPANLRAKPDKVWKELGDLLGFDWRTWEPTKEDPYVISAIPLEKRKATHIQLTPVEMQSGTTRQRLAERLIHQLPDGHEGKNNWLLNYGTGNEAIFMRSCKGIKFDEDTQAAEVIRGSVNKTHTY